MRLLTSRFCWLLTLSALLLGAALDACRRPQDQITAKLYVAAVRAYQTLGRPVLSGFVQCRYRPGCSEYSRQAVCQHGILRGLLLTVERLYRCRSNVAPDTPDPVPEPDRSGDSGAAGAAFRRIATRGILALTLGPASGAFGASPRRA